MPRTQTGLSEARSHFVTPSQDVEEKGLDTDYKRLKIMILPLLITRSDPAMMGPAEEEIMNMLAARIQGIRDQVRTFASSFTNIFNLANFLI